MSGHSKWHTIKHKKGAADALAVAICHVHSRTPGRRSSKPLATGQPADGGRVAAEIKKLPRSWRQYRPPAHG